MIGVPQKSKSGRIEVRSVCKSFTGRSGQRTVALTDIDLDIRPGEFISIVGPSGCGKTTLLRILAGVTSASGEVSLDGSQISGPQQSVGMVFQQPLLLPWRNILENVLLPAQITRRDMRSAKERAMELLSLVGLQDFTHSYPGELSGGMQQRAGICRALVNDPDVLLMDEPFAALDAMSRDFMALELQRIWLSSPKTVVFVTHSIPEAVFLSDRIVVMTPRPGRIAEILTVDADRPRGLSVLSSPGVAPVVDRVRAHFALETGDR